MGKKARGTSDADLSVATPFAQQSPLLLSLDEPVPRGADLQSSGEVCGRRITNEQPERGSGIVRVSASYIFGDWSGLVHILDDGGQEQELQDVHPCEKSPEFLRRGSIYRDARVTAADPDIARRRAEFT